MRYRLTTKTKWRRMIKAWDVFHKYNARVTRYGKTLIVTTTAEIQGDDSLTLYNAGWSSSWCSNEPTITVWYKNIKRSN